jgi:glycosyltransferase involved in cell wall biosynthesis
VQISEPPRISVIVPAYNSANTIEACLNAIKNSTVSNYELIVVDDGSQDLTRIKASPLACKVIFHPSNLGRSAARASGIKIAAGSLIVCVDSDILIDRFDLFKIEEKFSEDPNCSVISGLLSDSHPSQNFTSQYCNLRLNYLYRNLPEKIAFFYGGIFAFRKELKDSFSSKFEVCEDTDIGVRLAIKHYQISLLKNVIVSHLKEINFINFVRSDFTMAFNWANLFIENQVWKFLICQSSLLLQLIRYLFPIGFIFFLIQRKEPIFVLKACALACVQSIAILVGGVTGLTFYLLTTIMKPLISESKTISLSEQEALNLKRNKLD